MGRTWVLRTEAKGTGAHVVPLESVTERSSAAEPVFVPRKPERLPEPQAPEPKPVRRFRIIDVMTRQALVEDASTRRTVDALKEVRSIVDVSVYTWEEADARWRLLTFGEKHTLWELARGERVADVAE